MFPLDVRLANFLDSVSFFADKARQRAVWVEKRQGVSSVISRDELFIQFFEDNEIDDFITHELDSSPLTGEQRSAIREFRDAAETFFKAHGKSAQMPDKDLIDDPEWNELVSLAQRTLAVFGSGVYMWRILSRLGLSDQS